jgi:hypothetical protein
VKARLRARPSEFIVVAGPNDAGKETFLREVLEDRDKITQVDLAKVSSSLSGITEAFAGAFGCHWLDYRSALVNVLPFAGGEILVMKERTVRGFRQKFTREDAIGSHACSLEALLLHACDQCHSSRVSTTSYHYHCKLCLNTEGFSETDLHMARCAFVDRKLHSGCHWLPHLPA